MEKLSSATLRDRPGEEKLVSIFGKERRLVLKRGEKLQKRACRAFYIFVILRVHAKKSLFFSQLDFSGFHHIPVGATNSHSHPHVSEKRKGSELKA